MNRWWTYQRERFPLVGHGPLIAAFSFCAVSLSVLLRDGQDPPQWPKLLVAFVTCLLLFLQLRIADEFKDFAEDAEHRPYRPVQRGLVSLRELGCVFVGAAAVQLAMAAWLDWRLIGLLLVTWTYLALMSKEFFIREWLKSRPIVYMVSHMAIIPLVDLYATGTDWLAEGDRPPQGLAGFLAASFFNGMVIEIGRKLRSPDDEEVGVETYTVLWGRRAAVGAWLGLMLATAACAVWVATHVGSVAVVGGTLAAVFAGSAAVAIAFVRNPVPGRGKRLEALSGVWTLGLYLSLGAWPWIARWLWV
ncbi:MAG: UbiA family prenyltransferase [Planctomycetota bacterium]